jgi:alpha-ribazole phosphatase
VDLILIRHPAPAVDTGVCYGSTDVPLAGDAAESARSIVARLGALAVPLPEQFATSPLRRCADVAQRLARHFDRPCGVDPSLREIDFGQWEGQRWDAIDRAALDAWAADLRHARMHGGESVAQFEARVDAWLARWREPAIACASSVFAVTHAGVMRMIAALLLREALETTLTWPLDMAALVWLRCDGDGSGWRLLHWNA